MKNAGSRRTPPRNWSPENYRQTRTSRQSITKKNTDDMSSLKAQPHRQRHHRADQDTTNTRVSSRRKHSTARQRDGMFIFWMVSMPFCPAHLHLLQRVQHIHVLFYYCFRNRITFSETRWLSGTLILQLCVERIGTHFLRTFVT